MKKILCWLGFHDWREYNVYQSAQDQERFIGSCYKCARCGKRKGVLIVIGGLNE